MKKPGILIGVVCTVLVAVAAININLTSGSESDELVLRNVEVLAQGEGSGWGTCIGTGPIQCPVVDVKVYSTLTR